MKGWYIYMEKEIKINVNNISVLLTVAFVVLKLCGVISWSWFLVFLPVIIDVAIILVLLIVCLIVCLITRG